MCPAHQRNHLRRLRGTGLGQRTLRLEPHFLGPPSLILLGRIAGERALQRARALQADAARLQVVFQPLAARLAAGRRGANHDGVAEGFDRSGFEIGGRGKRRCGGRPARLGLDIGLIAPDKIDRQPLAVHLIARPVGVQSQHVDLIVERGHVPFEIELKRPLAGDFDRRLGIAAAGRFVVRGNHHVLRVFAAQQHVHADFAQQLEGLDAVDAQPLFVLVGFAFGRLGVARQQDCHLATAAVAGAEMKIDRVRGHHAIFGQFDVAGGDAQVVGRAGTRRLAADRDFADQRSADEAADLGPFQVERFVELENCSFGRLEDHRRRFMLISRRVAAEKHDRARRAA